jgi:prepilin-type N-terminal cleavage/methylation domain-containing protein/prepilin-type processing-associated H-X9-DG protein
MKKKGFTLIELLVVIAIIALLLSIISPSLRRAREAAWNIMCRNGLKHYGLAGQMYLEENRQTFPNAWGSVYRSLATSGHPRECQFHCDFKNPVNNPALAGSLWAYLGSQDKSHMCPVFERFAKQYHACPSGTTCEVNPIFGYSMNALLGGFELAVGPSGTAVYKHELQVRISDIRSPSTIFFFGEENPWVESSRYGATLNDNALCGTPAHPTDATAWTTSVTAMITKDAPGYRYLDCLATFHKTTFEKRNDGESNVVFIDGHVEMTSWENTYKISRWTNKMPPRK